MRSPFLVAAATIAGHAMGFPAAVYETVAAEPKKFEAMAANLSKRLNGIDPGFDATKQYISTTGKYKWVAPGPTDQRGLCPGLNALANHGYLPHNGIATIAQFIEATTTVVGMGADLAGFLSVYGAIFDGDLTKWSIGGPDSRVGVPLLGTPLGLVGTPQGISGSHNKYDSDVSPTRGDLYEYGNDYLVVMKQFTTFYATQAHLPDNEMNFDLTAQTKNRVLRFQQSLDNNPYFFNNFFSGLLVQPAAYTFQFRFMANHSEQYPEGRLSGENLKSWFGITGEYPNFQHTAGYERIPDNWYRRAYGDEYTIPYFLGDVVAMGVEYPQFFSIGGNFGKVNTFAGLDITNLTGGLYNVKDFSNPNTLACFVYELLTQQGPDILEGPIELGAEVFDQLEKAAGALVVDVACNKLNQENENQFAKAMMAYPGYSKLNKMTGKYD